MNKRLLSIKLDIAGKPYEMDIDPRNEEIYRLAAREINNRMAKAQQSRVDGFSIQDYLAIVAVDLMIANIHLERRNDIGGEDIKRLSALSERLSLHLER